MHALHGISHTVRPQSKIKLLRKEADFFFETFFFIFGSGKKKIRGYSGEIFWKIEKSEIPGISGELASLDRHCFFFFVDQHTSCFYILDCHSCNSVGLSVAEETAVFMTFSSISELLYLHTRCTGYNFELTPVAWSKSCSQDRHRKYYNTLPRHDPATDTLKIQPTHGNGNTNSSQACKNVVSVSLQNQPPRSLEKRT